MKVSRRLVLCGAPCAFSVFALSCGGSSKDPDASVRTVAGLDVMELRLALSSLEVGQFVALGESVCVTNPNGAIVGRDANGVYALSNSCTHQRGTVTAPDASGTARCCLHGAEYDGTGAVTKGIVPDQPALTQWSVRLEGFELVVRVGEAVARGTRLPV
jgi:nitrite reductase/ring-hydroxylating ferredoxin subunit